MHAQWSSHRTSLSLRMNQFDEGQHGRASYAHLPTMRDALQDAFQMLKVELLAFYGKLVYHVISIKAVRPLVHSANDDQLPM